MTGIQLQFYSSHNGNMFGEITDDHIRAIVERAVALGLLPTTEKSSEVHQGAPMSFANYPIKGWTDKPAAPADDEATVSRIAERLMRANNELYSEDVRLIFDMVRRGEVHGLMTSDDFFKQVEFQCRVLNAEIKRLNALNDKEFKERMATTNERDTLKAEVERLRKDLCESTTELKDQRDTARAAHAEAMGLLKYIDGNYDMADYCRRLDDDIKDYLAKYGKDASK